MSTTVSIRVIHVILKAAGERGVDPGRVLDRAGAADLPLDDLDARVPIAVESAIWSAAVEATGDPGLGFHAALAYEPGDYDVTDHSFRHAATLADGVRRLARYKRLLHDVAELVLTARDGGLEVEHRWPGATEAGRAQMAEHCFAWLVGLGRDAAEEAWSPAGVTFAHAAPPHADELAAWFECEVTFDRPMSAVLLDRETVGLALARSEPGLGTLLERYAEEQLARLPRCGDFVARVRRAVERRLHDGEARLDDVARDLHVSPRTLQRRLGERDTTFREILDDTRRRLAVGYVRNQNLAISEVAYLVGFSEPSAFHRAFRRWTGETPGAYREASVSISS